MSTNLPVDTSLPISFKDFLALQAHYSFVPFLCTSSLAYFSSIPLPLLPLLLVTCSRGLVVGLLFLVLEEGLVLVVVVVPLVSVSLLLLLVLLELKVALVLRVRGLAAGSF